MPLPEKIIIGPYVLTVTEDEFTHCRKSVEGGRAQWGCIEFQWLRIILDPKQAESHKRVALLHEVLHGVVDIADQRHEHEEDIIRAMAATLLDVLRRNPALVAYLTGDE